MAESSSFSSLFALVDNHLSKSNIQEDRQEKSSGLGTFQLPTLNIQRGLSDVGLPSTSGLSSTSMKLPLPSLSLNERPVNNVFDCQISSMFQPDESRNDKETEPPNISMSDCPINDILAIQLSNMFKAREAKEQEKRKQLELQKAQEDLQKLELAQSSCLIDLMPAVQLPGQIQNQHISTLSSGSSMESFVMPDTLESVEDDNQVQPDVQMPSRPASPFKSITTDMSYMLKHKIGKCSEFGKVLCARYRPVAAPYFREHVPLTNVKVFDFSTPSPDDIILERSRKPYYNHSNHTITVYD